MTQLMGEVEYEVLFSKMFFTSRASRGSQAAAIFSSLGGEEISSEEVTTLCEKKTQKVKTSELTSTAPLLARQPSTGALLPNISAMFISTFLFLSVFFFYCYYFYLISQQCSSWSPESSAKSQQCPSLPRLTKGQLSSSNCALSTLYYDGTTATHSAPRSPICLLAIFTSREKPSRYIRWSCTSFSAWRGVSHKVHYNRVHCTEQHAGYRAPDRVRTSHTNPHCPAIPIPAKSDL